MNSQRSKISNSASSSKPQQHQGSGKIHEFTLMTKTLKKSAMQALSLQNKCFPLADQKQVTEYLETLKKNSNQNQS